MRARDSQDSMDSATATSCSSGSSFAHPGEPSPTPSPGPSGAGPAGSAGARGVSSSARECSPGRSRPASTGPAGTRGASSSSSASRSSPPATPAARPESSGGPCRRERSAKPWLEAAVRKFARSASTQGCCSDSLSGPRPLTCSLAARKRRPKSPIRTLLLKRPITSSGPRKQPRRA